MAEANNNVDVWTLLVCVGIVGLLAKFDFFVGAFALPFVLYCFCDEIGVYFFFFRYLLLDILDRIRYICLLQIE